MQASNRKWFFTVAILAALVALVVSCGRKELTPEQALTLLPGDSIFLLSANIQKISESGLYDRFAETEDAQKAAVAKLRTTRDAAAVDRALTRLENAAKDEVNLMPVFIDAVKAYCTLGEMIGVLKGVYGEYLEPAVF